MEHFSRSQDHLIALLKSINNHHDQHLNGDGDMTNTNPKGSELELELRDLAGALYASKVCVGTPPQCMTVAMDTGSTNFWVPTTDCIEATCMNSPVRFDPSKSSTFDKKPADADTRKFKVKFGTGKIHAALVRDRVALGGEAADLDQKHKEKGESKDGLLVGQQLFGAVWSEEGAIFRQWKFSGVMGLAMPEMAIFHHLPVFDHIMKNKQLDYDAFSFVLDKDKPRMELGMPRQELYTGEVTWLSVTKTRYWTSELDDILVDGKSMNMCQKKGDCTALFDSGTTLNTLPSAALGGFLRAIGAQKGGTDCDPDSKELKSVTYVLGGQHFVVEPKDFLLSASHLTEEDTGVDVGGDGADKKVYDHSCSAQFMAMDLPPPRGPVYIIGEMFLRKFFVVFDRDQKRIGVAQRPSVLKSKLNKVIDEDSRVMDMLMEIESSVEE